MHGAVVMTGASHAESPTAFAVPPPFDAQLLG